MQQVAAVRRQHLYDPDGKPFSLAGGIRGRRARRGCGNGRVLRSRPAWITASVSGAAFRVKAVQVHGGDLSSGSGRQEGRVRVRCGRRAAIHLPARFIAGNSMEESAVIQNGHWPSARPPCRSQAVSLKWNKCHPLSGSCLIIPTYSFIQC